MYIIIGLDCVGIKLYALKLPLLSYHYMNVGIYTNTHYVSTQIPTINKVFTLLSNF